MTQTTDTLEASLSLVLSSVRRAANIVAPTDTAIAGARSSLKQGAVLTGIEHLSMEAARQAVALIRTLRGRIVLPRRRLPLTARMSGTLEYACGSEAIIWVGCSADSHPAARRIADHVAAGESVEASLAAPTLPPHVRRATAVLAADCDDRVVSMWHRFAAGVQTDCRLAVLQLPGGNDANLRGACEAITWLTGVSCAFGGIDFATGEATPCPSSDEPPRGTVVCAIEIPPEGGIRIGDVMLPTPGLVIGLAARVMRFDGAMLWLCEDPAAAPADPAASALAALATIPPTP